MFLVISCERVLDSANATWSECRPRFLVQLNPVQLVAGCWKLSSYLRGILIGGAGSLLLARGMIVCFLTIMAFSYVTVCYIELLCSHVFDCAPPLETKGSWQRPGRLYWFPKPSSLLPSNTILQSMNETIQKSSHSAGKPLSGKTCAVYLKIWRKWT